MYQVGALPRGATFDFESNGFHNSRNLLVGQTVRQMELP